MKEQLFVGERVEKSKFKQAFNNVHMINKPVGALWTSDYINNEMGSDWVQWCLENEFMIEEGKSVGASILIPEQSARVYVVDCYDDLKRLYEGYRLRLEDEFLNERFSFLDFEKIGKDYDGIYLSVMGQVRTRLSGQINLYGWDCQCVLWLNWCFKEVHYLGEVKFLKG